MSATNTRARSLLVVLALLAAFAAFTAVDSRPSGAAAGDCIEITDEIDLSPDFTGPMITTGNRIYVVVDDSVVMIDTATNTEIGRVDLGVFLTGMAVTDGKLYVGTVGPDNVEVLDADTLDPITTIGGFTAPVRPSVIDGLVYFPQQGANTVEVIDPATDTVVDSIPSLGANASYAIDGTLYVMGIGATGIDVIDPALGASVANITVGTTPVGMTAIGRQAWVTNAGDDTVSEVDLDTNSTVGAPIPVAGNPRAITVLDGALYYASSDEGLVQAIDPADGALGASVAFPGGEEANIGQLVTVDDRLYAGTLNSVAEISFCGGSATTTTTTPGSSVDPARPVVHPAQPARPLAGQVPRFTG